MKKITSISKMENHHRKFGYLVLFVFLILLHTINVFGQQTFFAATEEKENIFAIVEDSDGVKHKVRNLIVKFGRDGKYFQGRRGSSSVDLFVSHIATLEVVGSQKKRILTVVKFCDGKKDKFTFKSSYLYLGGESTYGKWALSGDKLKRITFTDSKWHPIVAAPESISTSSAEAAVDQIILKNGDIISGNVQNEFFTVKASYGDFKFDKPKIREIQFEGGGQNIDFVILKIGDKISGVVQEQKVLVKMITGNETHIDKEKIKSIAFKK